VNLAVVQTLIVEECFMGTMGKGVILWLLGVPVSLLALLWFLGILR
jgi:hypothetical protein